MKSNKFKVSTYFDTWTGNKKIGSFDIEVRFLSKIISRYKMKNPSILDVGCGSGLHMKKLIEGGYNVEGIDISKNQIKNAKLNINKKDIKLFRGDIKIINLRKKYNIIYSIQYALNYSMKNEDLSKSLRNINKHLKRNSIFIFELMNPYRYLIKYRSKTWKSKKEILITKYDPKNQIVSAIEYYPNKNLRKPYKIRLFFPEEIKFHLEMCGFKLINIYGSYDKKSKFNENSKMIFLCKKNKVNL